MNQRMQIELAMAALELRLAARTPAELLGRRLTSQRLGEIAAILEGLIAGNDAEYPSALRSSNDVGPCGPVDSITRAVLRRN